jgi:protocatechuate 3,4-dioxygenase beta subunit
MLPVPSNRWKTLASALLIGLSATASAQQTPAVHVSGVVIDAQTDTPLRHARVTPVTTTSLATSSFTDDNGRFSVDVVSGATLKVAKAGYVEQTVKAPRPAGTDPADLRVGMIRGAAISGRVVDETGAPVQGAMLVAWEMESAGSQRAIRTNDLGEFRIGGLSEGVFFLGATTPGSFRGPQSPVDGRMLRDAVAAVRPPVRVRPGDSVDAGDIVIRTGPTTPTTSANAAADVVYESTGTVAGRVRDTTGRPVKVAVDLIQPGSPVLSTASNAQGWFRFERVAPGRYVAQVTRKGAMTARFGQRGPGQPGAPIVVRRGTSVNGIDFVLPGAAAISGTVSDEYGEPVEGARVRVLQIRRVGDRMAALPPESESQLATSDDRGRYRLSGILPGRYLVVADGESYRKLVGDPISTTGYMAIYYPNATNVTFALPVTIADSDLGGIDLAFRSEPAARVAGTIVNSSGQAALSFVALGISQRSGAMALEPRTAPPAANGTYVFENVPPGDYVVQATTAGKPIAGGARTTEFATTYVTITGGESVLVPLRTSPGSRVRGRVTVDGPASARPPVMSFGPLPTDFDRSMMGGLSLGMPLDADGSFEVAGITGPRRFVPLSPADGWYVKAVRVHGVDALDAPFDFGADAQDVDDVEIVVSPAAAAVTGKVFGSAGDDALTDYAVLLFSTDSSRWYRQSQALRLERPSQNGEFRIGSLPPGSYRLVAIGDSSDLVTSGDWQDPAVLEQLRSAAVEVTVGEGDARAVTLKLLQGK